MTKKIVHEFVKNIPNHLADNTLYISIEYTTAAHKCFCGCGHEISTPLAPTDWRVIYDGKSVSLYPSIGNWNLPCKSHYWIENDEIYWAETWSDEEVKSALVQDQRAKSRYYGSVSKIESEEKSTFNKIKRWMNWD